MEISASVAEARLRIGGRIERFASDDVMATDTFTAGLDALHGVQH